MGLIEEIFSHFPKEEVFAVIDTSQGPSDKDIQVIFNYEPPAKSWSLVLGNSRIDIHFSNLEHWKKLDETRSLPCALFAGAYIAYRVSTGLLIYGEYPPNTQLEFEDIDGLGLLILAVKASREGRNSKANLLLELAATRTFNYLEISDETLINYMKGRDRETKFDHDLAFEVFKRYEFSLNSYPYLAKETKQAIRDAIQEVLEKGDETAYKELEKAINKAESEFFGSIPKEFIPGGKALNCAFLSSEY